MTKRTRGDDGALPQDRRSELLFLLKSDDGTFVAIVQDALPEYIVHREARMYIGEDIGALAYIADVYDYSVRNNLYTVRFEDQVSKDWWELRFSSVLDNRAICYLRAFRYGEGWRNKIDLEMVDCSTFTIFKEGSVHLALRTK